jgi:hypothetical protein
VCVDTLHKGKNDDYDDDDDDDDDDDNNNNNNNNKERMLQNRMKCNTRRKDKERF